MKMAVLEPPRPVVAVEYHGMTEKLENGENT